VAASFPGWSVTRYPGPANCLGNGAPLVITATGVFLGSHLANFF